MKTGAKQIIVNLFWFYFISPLVYWAAINPVPLAVFMLNSPPYPPLMSSQNKKKYFFKKSNSHVSMDSVPGLGEVGVDLGQELVCLR